MSKRIPQHFIDDLLNRTDIVALIASRMELRKAGREYSARCPFHEEKTPSFTVSPTKQFYHCFGCGAHGNALGFLMEHDRLEFLDAIDELASVAGVEVPREFVADSGRDHRDDYALMERAARFYRESLAANPAAIEYLKSRGLDKTVVNRFYIGYAPGAWTPLLERMRDEAALVRNGLAIQRERSCYDRFRNRIMFPIRDTRGRVIAFGGRVLGSADDDPKYLNSPETDLFHKGRHLYGLYEARQATSKLPRLLVVEGYMDVVALAQYGLNYAVATLGTATTEEHLEILFRHTSEVVFCFDGDNAGRQAAWRALERSLAVIRDGRELRFLFLPQGEDPDTLVRARGREGVESLLAEAKPLSQFLLDELCAQVELTSLDGRARLVELARPHIAKIRPSAFRTLLLDQLARIVHMQRSDLEGVLHSNAPGTPAAPGPSARALTGNLTPVRRALLRLLEKPTLAQTVDSPGQLRDIDVPGSAFLAEVIEFLREHPHYYTGTIIEHWRDRPEGEHLAKLARLTLPVPDEGIEQEFRDTIGHLLASSREQRLNGLLAKGDRVELSPDEKRELGELLNRRRGQ